MNRNKFDTAIVLADWREPMPNWFWIDAADCGRLTSGALPPVPLIAVGDRSAPGAEKADMIADDWAICGALGQAIDAAPRTAAATVQCLRAAAGLTPLAALTIESATMAMLQGSAEHRSWLAACEPSRPSARGEVEVSRTGTRLDVRLARSDVRNAIDREMRDGLSDAFMLAEADGAITAIRLTAAGRCFSVGADLGEFGTTRDPATAHLIRLRTLPALTLLRRRCRFDVHVQGACIGSGLELAAFADRLSATRDAWFQLPELAMGILPGFGGTVSIPQRIGRQRAAELIVSGHRITARSALEMGLIDEIVDHPSGHDRGANPVGR